MKKSDIIRLFLLSSIGFLLFSCVKEKANTIELDNNFIKHEFSIDGKTICFSLPNWYTNKGVESKRNLPQYIDNDAVRQSEFVFFSSKNDNNYLSFFLINDSLDSYLEKFNDSMLDSLILSMTKFYTVLEPGTVFSEKKWDKNNRPYCFIMASCRYYDHMRHSDSLYKLLNSDSIKSEFLRITYFGKKRYMFILSSIETLKEFSYEEKRRVLESISIEESK